MSRRIASRIKIKGTLKTQGPLHVGGMGGNEDVDLMIALDGKNQPYIPGTSLTGALRSWLLERTDIETVESLFGSLQEKKSDQGYASFIMIEDGAVSMNGKQLNQIIEIRDGVGIDRISGAAADKAKYDRAVLPHGTLIGFEMAFEIHDRKTNKETGENKDETEEEFVTRKAKVKSQIGALLQALQKGDVRFGAAKSRGHGFVKLEEKVEILDQDLKSPAGILQVLKKTDAKISIISLEPANASLTPVPQITIQINWQPDGPLMVKAERDGVAADMLPLTTSIGDMLTFSLPGSSIKGALRSQAERIMRTVVPEIKSEFEFLKQVEVPLVMDLFGAVGKSEVKGDDPVLNGPPLPGLSALFVEDCYAKEPNRFSRECWADVEQADSSEHLIKALEKAGLSGKNPQSPQLQQAFHVAVDRWTGGAADGFLYSVLEPHGIAWKDILIKFKLNRIHDDKRWAGIACLLFVLRDLANGRIPLGFGANRGMGGVIVNSITFKVDDANDEMLMKLEDISIKDGKINLKDEDLKKTLKDAWIEEIEEIKNNLGVEGA